MTPSDLPHVAWLVGVLERLPDGRLVIPEHAYDQVERTLFLRLDDPDKADSVIDQLLRFADGAAQEGEQPDLARAVVSMLLRHPAGRARLDAHPDAGWAQFVDQAASRRAPVYDEPAPEGTVPLDAIHNPLKKLR